MKKKQDLKLINIINKVKATINDYQMIQPKDIIVVGVSGGPDSVCLLYILYDLRDQFDFRLIVGHFNHGLRPGEDEKETEFVRSITDSLGIPFEYQKAEEDIKKGEGSLEEKARILRYEFLEKVRKKFNAHKIALGHNMNDQAETVMMRLLRGSGVSGLKGIPPIREDRIIRPIIKLTRGEVLYYLKEKNLNYMIDPSNMDRNFLRNKIRYELIPFLMQYQPNIIEILSKTSEILGIEDDFLESETKKWAETNVEYSNKTIIVPIESFKNLHDALKNRIIRYLLKTKMGHLRKIRQEHIRGILHLIYSRKPNTEIRLPYNLVVKRAYNKIIIESKKEYKNFYYIIHECGSYYLDAIGCWVVIEELKSIENVDNINKDKNTVLLNADMIDFPIIIRNFRVGDKIALEGINGHKKIKDIFIDMKIPRDIRKIIPILVHKDMPIYIWGVNRIDKKYKIKSKNDKILKITLKPEKVLEWEYIYKEADHVIG